MKVTTPHIHHHPHPLVAGIQKNAFPVKKPLHFLSEVCFKFQPYGWHDAGRGAATNGKWAKVLHSPLLSQQHWRWSRGPRCWRWVRGPVQIAAAANAPTDGGAKWTHLNDCHLTGSLLEWVPIATYIFEGQQGSTHLSSGKILQNSTHLPKRLCQHLCWGGVWGGPVWCRQLGFLQKKKAT